MLTIIRGMMALEIRISQTIVLQLKIGRMIVQQTTKRLIAMLCKMRTCHWVKTMSLQGKMANAYRWRNDESWESHDDAGWKNIDRSNWDDQMRRALDEQRSARFSGNYRSSLRGSAERRYLAIFDKLP